MDHLIPAKRLDQLLINYKKNISLSEFAVLADHRTKVA